MSLFHLVKYPDFAKATTDVKVFVFNVDIKSIGPMLTDITKSVNEVFSAL